MNGDQIKSAIRTGLIYAGGYLAAHGVGNAGEWAIIAGVDWVSVGGAAVAIGSGIWGLVAHAKSTKQLLNTVPPGMMLVPAPTPAVVSAAK